MIYNEISLPYKMGCFYCRIFLTGNTLNVEGVGAAERQWQQNRGLVPGSECRESLVGPRCQENSHFVSQVVIIELGVSVCHLKHCKLLIWLSVN